MEVDEEDVALWEQHTEKMHTREKGRRKDGRGSPLRSKCGQCPICSKTFSLNELLPLVPTTVAADPAEGDSANAASVDPSPGAEGKMIVGEGAVSAISTASVSFPASVQAQKEKQKAAIEALSWRSSTKIEALMKVRCYSLVGHVDGVGSVCCDLIFSIGNECHERCPSSRKVHSLFAVDINA